jgi:uncharacterized protein
MKSNTGKREETMYATLIRDNLVATLKLKVVGNFYDQLAASNVEAVLSLLASDVSWTEAEGFPYYSGTWIGPDAVLNNLLKRLATEWIDFKATPYDFMIEGDRVVSFGEYSGIYRKTGKQMHAKFAHVWVVRENLIRSFQMYTDTLKVIESMKV